LRWREFPIIHALTLPLTGVPEGFTHCKFDMKCISTFILTL
jgi:hypothetical protein